MLNTKKFWWLGLLLALLVLYVSGVGLGWWSAGSDGEEGNARLAGGAGNSDSSQILLVCELVQLKPTRGLDSPPEKKTVTVAAGLDFKQRSGWYQGEYALSESRKGTLVEEGRVVHVSRPALFERYGDTVVAEEFTLNRDNGEFVQVLKFKAGRVQKAATGWCARLVKAPF